MQFAINEYRMYTHCIYRKLIYSSIVSRSLAGSRRLTFCSVMSPRLEFRSTPLMSLCLVVAVLTLLLYQPSPIQAIILCDGDCMDNTDLEICRPYNDSRTPLYVMGFFPCNTDTFRARGFTVAAQMAIRAVQRDRSITTRLQSKAGLQ